MDFLRLLGLRKILNSGGQKEIKPVTLLTNLKNSSHYDDADRALHAALSSHPAGDLKLIPVLDDRWNGESLHNANCYSFATNADPLSYPHALLFLPLRPQPGELAVVFNTRGGSSLQKDLARFNEQRLGDIKAIKDEDKRFQAYADMVAADVEADGLLKPLGQQFACSARGYPVALFLSYPDPVEFIGMDYHFYALRRKSEGSLVWASKLSNDKVTNIPADRLFQGAAKKGYSDFIGYYERPYDLSAGQN